LTIETPPLRENETRNLHTKTHGRYLAWRKRNTNRIAKMNALTAENESIDDRLSIDRTVASLREWCNAVTVLSTSSLSMDLWTIRYPTTKRKMASSKGKTRSLICTYASSCLTKIISRTGPDCYARLFQTIPRQGIELKLSYHEIEIFGNFFSTDSFLVTQSRCIRRTAAIYTWFFWLSNLSLTRPYNPKRLKTLRMKASSLPFTKSIQHACTLETETDNNHMGVTDCHLHL